MKDWRQRRLRAPQIFTLEAAYSFAPIEATRFRRGRVFVIGMRTAPAVSNPSARNGFSPDYGVGHLHLHLVDEPSIVDAGENGCGAHAIVVQLWSQAECSR